MSRAAILVFALSAFACAGRSECAPEAAGSPWHYSHDLGQFGAGCVAKSTDTTKVQLRGETCTDDGAECFDIANNPVEVWETSAAEDGTPYGSASFVEIDSCDQPTGGEATP